MMKIQDIINAGSDSNEIQEYAGCNESDWSSSEGVERGSWTDAHHAWQEMQ